ncbi:SusC/RagA family TonB-linked outer membrane protein [Flavobacterium sp. GSP27]|uniref:SusC/RagA family TonB-linked outer membrane protein n=1 Tax=unclassified Flavobacterium TaxID=196869 RepID=UPI000F81F821|nr:MULTISPECIES: SusC/RagA family TonB-linked outer membrane protein [unclassified Flavobacterium]RTY76648.1 SusC/RagA family TonB-linked outer membrane protein [Flavobacterium sp. LS1R10]RTY95690.1 SusC/RagA family TonB-linked outer membrane protein [Flavobacterium sp. GSN2]RTZ08764.1 SusC/RagA family TonB-linked outer membrane protein [Flavobacterium sp. GSP27]
MKNSLIKGLMVFLTMLCTSLTYSQDVSGTVSDGSGPLPGASVLVKGTTNGAQTDFDGKFTIKNVGSNAVLVFSYIGLKSQEVNVAGKSTISVVLKEDSAELKEVVVIGYGTVKKKDATGAVDQISSKKFDNVAAINPAELLRGKVAGVQITSSSGEPGAANSIRIRGNGTLRGGNGPLIVVDGVPLAGGDVSAGGANMNLGSMSAKDPLSFINQNDIESMSILKDASSTAIYGARGANGVIIITTKKGKSKVPELTYSTSYTTSSYASKFDVLSTDEFIAATPGQTANHFGGAFDWKKQVLQTGNTVNHDLSFSSGTDNSSTRVSLGMANTDGIVRNTGLDKISASFYNSNDFFDGKVILETRIAYSNIKDRRGLITNDTGYIGNLLSAALYWNPTRSVYDPAQPGGYTRVSGDYLNPVHLMNSFSNNGDLSKLLGSLTTTVKLTNSLKYNMVVGIETSNSSVKQQATPDLNIQDFATATNPADLKTYRGQATVSNDQRVNKTIEHNLTFTKDITKNINLNAIVGYSYYNYASNGTYVSAKGFAATQTNLLENMEGGIPTETRVGSYKGLVDMQSVFARASLAFYNKLNLDLTVRRDGSSKTAAGKKYGNFPSLGLAYKLVDGKDGLVNDFKLRGNIGKTGNTEFPRNSSVGIIEYNGPNQFNVVNNANSQLTWETTTSYGVGTDFALLNNKLTGSVDYFNKNTTDLIVGIPSTSGQPSPQGIKYTNLPANLINKGVEVSLSYKVIDTDDLTWDISGNVAFLSNTIENLGAANVYNVGAIHGQGLSDAYVQRIQDGHPLYTYYLPTFTGYDANGISQYADGGAVKLLDKQPLPKMTAGFSTSLAYKGFDFSTSLYGNFGNYLFNNTNVALFYQNQLGGKNVTPEVANSVQSRSDANTPSTKYLEKGDFIRMGNLTLGYTVKGDVLERFKVKSARFYVNGSNLFIITKYSGFDPEVDTNKSLNGVPSAGIDYLSYPRARTLSVGLNVTF